MTFSLLVEGCIEFSLKNIYSYIYSLACISKCSVQVMVDVDPKRIPDTEKRCTLVFWISGARAVLGSSSLVLSSVLRWCFLHSTLPERGACARRWCCTGTGLHHDERLLYRDNDVCATVVSCLWLLFMFIPSFAYRLNYRVYGSWSYLCFCFPMPSI